MTDEVTVTPCPWCNGPAKLIRPMGDRIDGAKEYPFYGENKYRVVCASLYEEPPRHCPGRACLDTEAEAIAAWNTRHQPQPSEDLIANFPNSLDPKGLTALQVRDTRICKLEDVGDGLAMALVFDANFIDRVIKDNWVPTLNETLSDRSELLRKLASNWRKVRNQ